MVKDLLNDDRVFRSNLIGTTAYFKRKFFTNETELSLGQARGKWDIAAYNRLNVEYKRLNISSEAIHAGKNYFGFYSNSFLLVNNINYHINAQFNVGFNSNITRINPSLDVLRYAVSPYSTTNMAFVSYQPNARNNFFFNFTRQEREDRQRPSTFHFKEDFANLSYTLNAPRASVFAQARYGYAENLLTTDSSRRRRSMAYLTQPMVAVLPWLWLGGYFEYQHTSKFSAQNILQDLYFYGGSVRLNYKKHLSLNFMYRNNYAPDELFEQRSFMDGALVLDYDRHQFTVNAGRAYIPNVNNTDQNTLFVSAKYLLKLNVPVKKNRKTGQIKGQIKSMSDGIRRDGILMQLGQYRILTDSAGRFSFPNLLPNNYFLTFANDLNADGVVPTVRMPKNIAVRADSTENVVIELVKTGDLLGRVRFETNEASGETTPSVSPTVYIKLWNDQERLMTQMNAEAGFSFKQIKPGNWQMKAILVGQTEQFELQNAEQTIEITSGEVKSAEILVKPIVRKIKFSGKTFNISTEKK
jgi:hypothetical protein